MNPWESPQFTAWVDAVFKHPVSKPEWYWDDNFGESSPGRLCHALIDDSVQLDTRVRCIREIYTLFRDLFAVAGNGPARHSSEPLHVACYMWWDIVPSWGVRDCPEPVIDGACLEVMTRTLEIPVEVCQIAALHGLNHWYLHHGEEVVEATRGRQSWEIIVEPDESLKILVVITAYAV
jgi:hypothetical protein